MLLNYDKRPARPVWARAGYHPRGSGSVDSDQLAVVSLLGTPVLSLGVAANDYPPKLNIGLGEAVRVGDVLRLQAASDAAFIYKLFDSTHQISGGDALSKAAHVTGLAAIARPAQTFFRARIERGVAFTGWSYTIKHGDSLRPTITSNATATYAELSPLAHQLTAGEQVTWTIVGGRDVSSTEISGSTLRLSGNALLDHEVQGSYQVIVRATDLGGNFSEQLITVQISNIGEQANSISFAPVKNAVLSQVHTSGVITVSGLAAGVAVPVTATNCSYSKNDGPFTTAPGSVVNGDRLVVRATSSSDFSTTQSAVITLGSGNEAAKGTFSVTTLQDPQGVGWVPESPPALRNMAFQSNVVDFANVNFSLGLGIIMVSSTGRRIETCSVDGVPAQLVCESGVKPSHASIWSIPVTTAGRKTVRVAHSAFGLGPVAIATGVLKTGNPAPVQTAARDYGYFPAPVSLGTRLSIPPHGWGLVVAVSENGTLEPVWSGAAGDGNVRGGSEVAMNFAFAHLTRDGTPEIAGWNYAGTALVAAVWKP
jgi:hypothetical protein